MLAKTKEEWADVILVAGRRKEQGGKRLGMYIFVCVWQDVPAGGREQLPSECARVYHILKCVVQPSDMFYSTCRSCTPAPPPTPVSPI